MTSPITVSVDTFAPDGKLTDQQTVTLSPQASSLLNAQQGVATLHGEVPLFQAQLQADIATVTAGWQTLTAQQQTDIVLRILSGFGTAMQGLLAHATITGAIPAS